MTADQEIKPAPHWCRRRDSGLIASPTLLSIYLERVSLNIIHWIRLWVYSFYYSKSFNTWNTSRKRSGFPTGPIEIPSCKWVVKKKKAFGQLRQHARRSSKHLNFASMFFWKLLYSHNTSVDSLSLTFQLQLEKILAWGIKDRLIYGTKILDISRYLEYFFEILRKCCRIFRHFL